MRLKAAKDKPYWQEKKKSTRSENFKCSCAQISPVVRFLEGGGSKRYKMYFREIGTKQNVTWESPVDRDSLDSPGSVPGGTSTAEMRSHSREIRSCQDKSLCSLDLKRSEADKFHREYKDLGQPLNHWQQALHHDATTEQTKTFLLPPLKPQKSANPPISTTTHLSETCSTFCSHNTDSRVQ